MKVWGFLALRFFLSFFLSVFSYKDREDEWILDGVLGNFKIVKGVFLHGYSC